ncbi:MAG: hypothetical protein HYS13_07305 [Planctomycetia bacterium]|nr:hypothetical protein [Planctomycetia bacterium]
MLVSLLFFSLLPACAAVPRVVSPVASANLPSEHTLVLDQLVIYSDEPLPRHHRLLEEVSLQREELLDRLALPRSDEPIYVYLFSSPDRFSAFLRLYYPDFPPRRAFFVEGDTRLVVYAQWGDRTAEDLRHEVTHGYLHSVVPGIPLWLDEGLAEYCETGRGQSGFHRAHCELLAKHLAAGWRPDLARLEALADGLQMTQLDYAECWAWTHFLLSTSMDRRELLAGYLREVKQSGRAAPFSPSLQRLTSPMAAEEMLLGHLRSLSRAR